MNRHVATPEAASVPLQRVRGTGVLSVRTLDGRTRIERLFQEGAAKIRFPASPGGHLEAVLINTAGGLTGGDRMAWRVDVGADAAAVFTTQACEKVYRSTGAAADVRCTLAVAAGGHLSWLPQETIVFDRSCFRRTIDATIAPGATALIVESTLFGRLARGERVTAAMFADRWRVRVGERLVHAEDFRIGPEVAATLARPACAAGGLATATVLAIGGDLDGRLGDVRDIVGDRGGASAWNVGGTGKLLARLVTADGYALRQRLAPLIHLLNGEAGLPKVWST
ncbi:MAG: urease accessory protein UreD [Rhizobiaceae bacterium]